MSPSTKSKPNDNKFDLHELRKEILKQEIDELLSTTSGAEEADGLKAKIEQLTEDLQKLEEGSGKESQVTHGTDNENKAGSPSFNPSAKEELHRVYDQLHQIQSLPRAENEDEARMRRIVTRILEKDTVERESKIIAQKKTQHQRAEKLTSEAADALEIDLHYDRQDNAFRALRNEWVLFFLERVAYMRKLAQAGPLQIAETLRGEEDTMNMIETELANMNATRLRLKKSERTFMISSFRNKSLAYNMLLLQKKRRFLMLTWDTRKNLLLIRPVKWMLSFAFRNIRRL